MLMMLRILDRRPLALVGGVVVLLSAPLAAQQTAPPPPVTPPVDLQTPATPVAPAGPVLALSMAQAVQMGVDQNLGLQISKLNLNMADETVMASKAAFLPQVTGGLSRTTVEQPPQTLPDGTVQVSSSNTLRFSNNVGQALPWLGAQYSVTWSGNRSESAGNFATFNPSLGSTLSAAFDQPLWRNLSIDPNRAALESARQSRTIADLTLQENILELQAQIQGAYLNLIAANQQLDVANQNMDLAKHQLHNNQAMLAVGQMAQLDVTQATAQVASNQEAIIIAQQGVADAQDALRSLILDPSRPDYWQVQINATDPITLTERTIDLDAAVKNALANRLDLIQARRTRDLDQLSVKLDSNQIHPGVDFQAQYTASGTGGTELANGVTITRNFGTVLGDAFGGAFPTWVVGVNVSYPVGQTAARANLARAEVQRNQQDLTIQSLELQVTAAVRQAARAVDATYQRVQATKKAFELTQQQDDAAHRRLEVGQLDTFTVLLNDQALAQARVNELTAMLAYNAALLQFDRVQRVP